MRLISKLFSGALTLALAVGLFAVPAFAEEGEQPEGTYRVTLYSGNQGTFAQGEQVVFYPTPGEDIAVMFNGIQVNVNDGKYYVKGIRPAEQNNGYEKYFVAKPNGAGVMEAIKEVPADKDVDYVVAYGLTSERVQYTVRFVNEAGADIADPVTYWGNVGDEVAPVASYVDGYVPNAVMQTKTLTNNQADNVIAFTYRNVPGVRTIQLPGNVIQVVTPEGATATITPAAPAEDGTTPEVTADDGTVIYDENGTPLAAPVDELSLDDNETPLAEAGEATADMNADAGGNPLGWMLPALIACIVAGFIVFLALFMRTRRKNEQAQ